MLAAGLEAVPLMLAAPRGGSDICACRILGMLEGWKAERAAGGEGEWGEETDRDGESDSEEQKQRGRVFCRVKDKERERNREDKTCGEVCNKRRLRLPRTTLFWLPLDDDDDERVICAPTPPKTACGLWTPSAPAITCIGARSSPGSFAEGLCEWEAAPAPRDEVDVEEEMRGKSPGPLPVLLALVCWREESSTCVVQSVWRSAPFTLES